MPLVRVQPIRKTFRVPVEEKASISVGHQAELREHTRLRGGSTVQFLGESPSG